ncbi:hypothetical protein C943_03072 [Mariniradius saccharolyticus AK6]|uniref:Uncharacterized protein n=1 Tax=Mariniradius saccharolyticus AK6 TaxID=1239962 RepID=M7XQS5_9BACT|nr:hypothetical protein C943_03072 [Mariniradius saccharolyticus AK6]
MKSLYLKVNVFTQAFFTIYKSRVFQRNQMISLILLVAIN